MSRKDPYDILGVSRSAGADEIKSAYRRLAKQHHPDRNPGDKSAEQRFKEVQAAYEVLGAAQRRAQYDKFGAGGPAPDFSNWTSGNGVGSGREVHFDFGDLGDLSSVFEEFFSRGRPRGRTRRGGSGGAGAGIAQARGADIEHAVELTFDEARLGTKREIVLHGSDGRDERIEFRIPPGVDDGQKIRLRGKGHDGAGGRGDLIIACRVRPHSYFRREGLDLLLDLPLSLAEATLGAKVEIPTLEGPTRIVVPPGTSSGTKLRLRGKGMRDERRGQTGDLYTIVRIEVPRELTPRARELMDELGRELQQKPRVSAGWAV